MTTAELIDWFRLFLTNLFRTRRRPTVTISDFSPETKAKFDAAFAAVNFASQKDDEDAAADAALEAAQQAKVETAKARLDAHAASTAAAKAVLDAVAAELRYTPPAPPAQS